MNQHEIFEMEVDAAKAATMRCGYYDIKVLIDDAGQHTFGEADKKVHFHCYGGVHSKNNKNEVYPAKFYSRIGISQGDKLKVDLDLARYIAANGQRGWEGRTKYNKGPSSIWHPEENFGDCSGLWYALGGVCHQMANSIFTACGKGVKSPLVWPPSFYLTWGAYGYRGNHTTYKNLPTRLKRLLKSYPKPIKEEVDRMGEDVRIMLTENTDTDAWRAEMLEDARFVLGDDFAKPGEEDAFIEKIRQLRMAKNDRVMGMLGGTADRGDFAGQLNQLGAETAQSLAEHLNDNLAAQFRAIKGMSVDPAVMHPEEGYRWLGKQL